MSNEKQETSARIIAEMRQGTRLPGYWRSCDVNEILMYHADRLEAAMKRERLLSKSPENDNSAPVVSTADNKPGNAAALREALSDACYAMFNFLKTQTGGYEEMANALDKAKAALTAPARNCDVGTADERAKRFEELCASHPYCTGCPVHDRWAHFFDCGLKKVSCGLIFAQMPYEAKEGSAK